jgi:hypothetical protein
MTFDPILVVESTRENFLKVTHPALGSAAALSRFLYREGLKEESRAVTLTTTGRSGSALPILAFPVCDVFSSRGRRAASEEASGAYGSARDS